MPTPEKDARGRPLETVEPREVVSAGERDARSVAGARESVEPLLLRQPAAAAHCGVSSREFRRWVARGFAPAPIVSHGGRPLWARHALESWAADLSRGAERRGAGR
jgi:hypothetical protein